MTQILFGKNRHTTNAGTTTFSHLSMMSEKGRLMAGHRESGNGRVIDGIP